MRSLSIGLVVGVYPQQGSITDIIVWVILPKTLNFWETLQFIKRANTMRMENTQNHDNVPSLMT